jgi:hypothetical protein
MEIGFIIHRDKALRVVLLVGSGVYVSKIIV